MLRRLKEGWRALRNLRKKLIARSFKCLLDRRFSKRPFTAKDCHRVALFRWDDKLGDTFWATSLIASLKQQRPDLEISLITGPLSARLVADWPLIDRLLITRRGGKAAWKLGQYRRQFDLVIDLGDSLSWKEWLALSRLKAPHYLGYERGHTRLFDLNIAQEHCHAKPRNLAAAAIVTGHWSDAGCYLPQNQQATNAVAAKLATATSPQVLINLFGSSKHRQFSAASAQTMLSHWRQTFPSHRLWLLAVPGKEAIIDGLVIACGDSEILTTGQLPSLAHTVAWISQTDLVFTPDTSIVHFAAYLGTPLIAVYATNPRNFALWGVSGPQVRALFTRPAHSRHDRVNVADFHQQELDVAISELLADSREG